MAGRDTVGDGHCDCIEKHDVSSEHRDESEFPEFPERRDEFKVRKVITNMETDQNSGKVFTNIETGQIQEKSSRTSRQVTIQEKVITNIETSHNSGKVITNIEMGEQDSDGRQKSRHERIPAERVDGSKLQQDTLNEFVLNMLMDQKSEPGKLKEFLMS